MASLYIPFTIFILCLATNPLSLFSPLLLSSCSLVGFSSEVFRYTLNISNGMAFAYCELPVPLTSQCSIKFSKDATYTNLSTLTVNGPVNSPFSFPLGESTSPVYHQASVTLPTLKIVVRSSSTTQPTAITEDDIINDATTSSFSCASGGVVLQLYQLGLLGLLVAILVLALVTCSGAFICLLCKGNLYSVYIHT